MTQEKIKEIAELLECGNQCFIHIKNKTIEYYPDPNDFISDLEPWQDVIDKVESNYDKYIKISKMDSNKSFQVMEKFIEFVSDSNLRNELEKALSRPKPFRNFKYIIEESEYRKAWFDFRSIANTDWVKKQFEEH